ncbi:hypothetical protein PCL1606_47350 [Pseudomonas chlororaphis]|uniref:Uncharacterized protein n=1 Tax=Pseudomonas chlororaphis TaxID=587753 RepID=A0A0D5Y4E1_9PSED|nr:hypothetical protein PCL1606_47350 [Pseudomonas chlororaphis]
MPGTRNTRSRSVHERCPSVLVGPLGWRVEPLWEVPGARGARFSGRRKGKTQAGSSQLSARAAQ